MEELVKYTIVMRGYFDLFGDRCSERVERKAPATQDPKQSPSIVQSAKATSDPERSNSKADVVNGVDINGI